MTPEHLKPLLAYIEFCYPKSFEEIKKRNLISPNLFSPFVLDLPDSLKNQVDDFVGQIYEIKESSDYQEQLGELEPFQDWPQTPSVLTCFDFHYSEEMGLKLIEINTNASLYLPMILQRCAQADVCDPPQFEKLYESFKQAFELKASDPISIFDEKPEQEGLYFEFLIFKEWFESLGHPSNIVSLENFEKNSHVNVYNRFTDFYFEEEKSAGLLEHYQKQSRLFSPNPREYFLMADKRRLRYLRQELEKRSSELASIIPETKLFSEFEGADDVWSQRKKYFFKPSHSFGSKGAFSGKGISRKAFDKLFSPDFIAQEFCPAGRREFDYKDEVFEMKFDLRFFTFDGQVQNYGARLYQGQTTNMKTPMGGITPIQYI
jgi:hypothetical protein